MTEIKLYIDFHNSKERLFAQFSYNSAINKIIKTVKGAAWSNSKKQWHFEVNKETVEMIRHKTKKFAVLLSQKSLALLYFQSSGLVTNPASTEF